MYFRKFSMGIYCLKFSTWLAANEWRWFGFCWREDHEAIVLRFFFFKFKWQGWFKFNQDFSPFRYAHRDFVFMEKLVQQSGNKSALSFATLDIVGVIDLCLRAAEERGRNWTYCSHTAHVQQCRHLSTVHCTKEYRHSAWYAISSNSTSAY